MTATKDSTAPQSPTLSLDSEVAETTLPKMMIPPTRICVYCGASPGTDPIHLKMARQLARVMAANNIHLVYGGGTIGMMGELAKTLVALSGPDAVHGIIPEALLTHERAYKLSLPPSFSPPSSPISDGAEYHEKDQAAQFGRTTIVPDMHTRKRLMVRAVQEGGPGSGFIGLSGGYGTMEEVLETVTWNQLGIHARGIVLLNVGGFYDGILSWVRRSVKEGFVSERNERILVDAQTAEEAVRALREYELSEERLALDWGNE